MECKLKDYREASTEKRRKQGEPLAGEKARIRKFNDKSKLGWMIVLCELVGQSDVMKAS